jgi:hypothetical protein
VTASPASSGSVFSRYATAFWKPSKGSASAVMRLSHLTCAMPYHPGTTRRSGKPCCTGNGAPFISYASSISSRRASTADSDRW